MLHPIYRYVVMGKDEHMMRARKDLAENVNLAQQVSAVGTKALHD